jgi:hypothetical protein
MANLNTSWAVFQRVATMLQESLEIYQTQCEPAAFDQVVQQVSLLTRAMHDINVDTARVAQTVQADRAWVHAMVQEMERRQEDTELELQLQVHFCNQWWVRYRLAEALAGAE